MCDSADVEDEYHFILIYSSYNDIHRHYLEQYYPSVFKFIQLCSQTVMNVRNFADTSMKNSI